MSKAAVAFRYQKSIKKKFKFLSYLETDTLESVHSVVPDSATLTRSIGMITTDNFVSGFKLYIASVLLVVHAKNSIFFLCFDICHFYEISEPHCHKLVRCKENTLMPFSKLFVTIKEPCSCVCFYEDFCLQRRNAAFNFHFFFLCKLTSAF